MRQKIIDNLNKIKDENNINIIFAIESGSRAWRLSSSDSDYDVRFVFTRPKDEYLTIEKKKDVINRTISDMDFVGFDIYKFCGLLNASNPSVIEWLESDIVYYGEKPLELIHIAKNFFNPIALFHHYRSMSKQNYLKYIKSGDFVSYKKYLYAMRGLINSKFVEHFGTIPPISFPETMDLINKEKLCPDYVVDKLKRIIEFKKDSREKQIVENIVRIDQYIESELNKSTSLLPRKNTLMIKKLNEYILNELE